MKRYQTSRHRLTMIRLRRRLAILVAVSGGLWSLSFVFPPTFPQNQDSGAAVVTMIVTLILAVAIDSDDAWLSKD